MVTNARRVKVTLADGRIFDATVVGSEPDVDIALLGIGADHLPVAEQQGTRDCDDDGDDANGSGTWLLRGGTGH